MEPFNNSSNAVNQTEIPTPATWQVAFLINTLIIGLPANAFIIWLTGWRLRCRGLSVFILSLATADFLFLCMTVLQIQETMLGDNWVLGTLMCRVRHYLYDLSYHCSLFLLAALSVDRCLMVLLPLWYRCHRHPRLSTYICLGAWLLAAIFSIKGFIFPKVGLMEDGVVACYVYRGIYEWPLRLLEVLLEGFLPFVVIVTTHAATLIRTFRRRTRPPSQFYRIVAATLSAYVLLNLPFQITQLIYLASIGKEFNSQLILFMVYFGYLINLGSSVNPLIYIFFGSNVCKRRSSSFATALTEEPGKNAQDTHMESFSA